MVIELTQNQVTTIDDKDESLVSGYKWYADFDKKLGKYYAKTTIRVNGKRVSLRLHRLIKDAQVGEVVDHINGDTLDNRSSNLRKCTQSDNVKNRSINKNSGSGYKGVVWHSQAKKWQSRISFKKKYLSLGLFEDKKQAALAYNEAAKTYYGEFAKFNLITSA